MDTANGTDTYALASIVCIDFIRDTTTVSVGDPPGRPASIDPSHLFQNYPNPFSPGTHIAFDLPLAGRAELRILDPGGRLIRTLIDRELPAGLHSVSWDGCSDTGKAMASGVYFYSLSAPGVDENRKMVLLK